MIVIAHEYNIFSFIFCESIIFVFISLRMNKNENVYKLEKSSLIIYNEI